LDQTLPTEVVILMETHLAELPATWDADADGAAVGPKEAAGTTLSLDTVETMGSSSLVAPSRTERVVIDETLAQLFGIAGCELRRKMRGQAEVARARQVEMYLAHVARGMSLTEVGRTFACDRTTISHACGVVEDGRDEPTFDRVLDLLE
jgi:chromosomal replication initiation ATPase DnaA